MSTSKSTYTLKEDLTASAASDDGSSGDDNDSVCDWASSLGEALQTRSLFSSTILTTPQAALQHDESQHGYSLKGESDRLELDLYGRMKLVNYIRKNNSTPAEAKAVTKDQLDDELLVPVIENDPLLQHDFDDEWSDDEIPQAQSSQAAIQHLQSLVQALTSEPDSTPPKRDDDTHYFGSYEENEIHEVMLRDATRTVSYGRFILSNPKVFKGATVMDVGCGTGILSMLAAKAGAKRVYAVEASGLASKARANVEKNGLADIIEVIQSKVEEVQIEGKVDVIISEWMGYMLLYESMLDSVLVARDRFLAPGGLVVPSQTRLVISAISAQRIWHERIDFWKSVYGFDMSVMDSVYYDDGIVEAVDAKEVVSTECIVKDVDAHQATIKSLDFVSPFTLECDGTPVRAFLTHFDTFFSPQWDKPVTPTEDVDIRPVDQDYTSEIAPVENRVSFTTGPRGTITHWKQVVFLLREPIAVKAGDQIKGMFHCRKSSTNSRELDVEIHYAVQSKGGEAGDEVRVQVYRVR